MPTLRYVFNSCNRGDILELKISFYLTAKKNIEKSIMEYITKDSGTSLA